MCFGVVKAVIAKVLAVITNKSSRSKSSDGDPPSALQPGMCPKENMDDG